MNIVTTKARHSAPAHHTLHKIVPLHTVLVCGAIGVVRERRLAQRVLLKLPKIPQV